MIAAFLAMATPVFAQQKLPFGLSEGNILTRCSARRIALAADADGDGRADFLSVYLPDGIVDFQRTSKIGKPCNSVQARRDMGRNVIAAATGRFAGGPGADVLTVSADGTVRIAYAMKTGTMNYSQATLVAQISTTILPKAPVWAVSGDFEGDGRIDVLLADANGKLLLLSNQRGNDGVPRFVPFLITETLSHLRRLSSGDLKGRGTTELVWSETDGTVYRASLTRKGDTARLQAKARILQAAPGDGLVVGRFQGNRAADIIVGRKLLPGGNTKNSIVLPSLPDAVKAATDVAWLAADFDGNGKDDLMRAQRSADRFDSDHVYLHFAYAGDEVENAPFADTDHDGLLNAWETGKIMPGGLNLVQMGCSPRHRDVIVEMQCHADVDEKIIRAEMDKAVLFYAALPTPNPDGSSGIKLHPLFREPIPATETVQGWGALGEKYHPVNHRGITHWMEVYNGGGGQSAEMADRGACGRYGMPATFLHEFGHQLGLDHTGFWAPNWCPTYPSLMNYAYNYQLNGRPDNIVYSDGRLAALTLNERHLSERLPLPPDKVAFLAGPPYRFHLKPTEDGKGTLIDWNWNGIFGEEDVAADINYGYSTTGGERHTIGKTYMAPTLVSYGEGNSARLLLFSGQLAAGVPLPASDLKATAHSITPENPGSLQVRVWHGNDPAKEGQTWPKEVEVEASGVTGEASACYLGDAVWVAYPTTAGVKIRRITLDADDNLKIGSPQILPQSENAQPTLTPFEGQIALLLWRGKTTEVALRVLASAPDATLQPQAEVPLGFQSEVPVGAMQGDKVLWIGLTQGQDKNRPARWQVRAFQRNSGMTMRQVQQEWVDGEAGADRGDGRVTLLWEPNKALGENGQLYFLQRGGPGETISGEYIAMRVADKTVRGGWLTRRYYDEWTNTRSAFVACFFRGDIALAVRWFGNVHNTENDNLFVAFFGRGIEDQPMGDFNDVAYIRDYGLVRSLPTVIE